MNRLEASKLPDAACAAFFAALAAAKRPLIYAGGGVINGGASQALREFVERIQAAGGDDADGHRRRRHHAPAVHAHARHARRGVRELRGRGLRFPDGGRRALRRSRGRQSAEIRGRRQVHRASRHRRLGDQQGQARRLEPRRADGRRAAESASTTARRKSFKRDWSEWRARCDELRSQVRHELRPRQRADSAVLRDRGDQPAHPRRGDHHHRRRPASDVGRAVFRFPQPAAVAHLRQHGHDGLRPAGRGGRAVRAALDAW